MCAVTSSPRVVKARPGGRIEPFVHQGGYCPARARVDDEQGIPSRTDGEVLAIRSERERANLCAEMEGVSVPQGGGVVDVDIPDFIPGCDQAPRGGRGDDADRSNMVSGRRHVSPALQIKQGDGGVVGSRNDMVLAEKGDSLNLPAETLKPLQHGARGGVVHIHGLASEPSGDKGPDGETATA